MDNKFTKIKSRSGNYLFLSINFLEGDHIYLITKGIDIAPTKGKCNGAPEHHFSADLHENHNLNTVSFDWGVSREGKKH